MLARLIRKNCSLFSRSFYAQNILETPINRNEDALKNNKVMMDEVKGKYQSILQKVTTQADPKVLDKLKKAGKLPVR